MNQSNYFELESHLRELMRAASYSPPQKTWSAYDEYYDCYICPNNKVLKYSISIIACFVYHSTRAMHSCERIPADSNKQYRYGNFLLLKMLL